MSVISNAIAAFLGSDAPDPDEMRTVPNRSDRRRGGVRQPVNGIRQGPRVATSRATVHADIVHPLAQDDHYSERPKDTVKRIARDEKLQAAWNEQQQAEPDDRPAWIYPWDAQAWKDARAARKRERAARRAGR